MNNSPERRVNGYVISQSKIHLKSKTIDCLALLHEFKKFFFKKKAAIGTALKRSSFILDRSCGRRNAFHSSHPNGFALYPSRKKHDAYKYEEEGTEKTKKCDPLGAVKLAHGPSQALRDQVHAGNY